MAESCKQAGSAILSVYNSAAIETHLKTDQSPVTNADLAAHRVWAEDLSALLPDCPVVSEEDEASWQSRQKTGRLWLIDPLDGTKEFLARNSEFTINIALIERGRSVCGLVYAPALALMCWGRAGLGAFCLRQNMSPHPIAVSRCNKNAHEPCRVIVSTSNLNAETQTFINRLGVTELVPMGSSLKFCHIAESGADIYPRLGPTCGWDTAAALRQGGNPESFFHCNARYSADSS